MTNRSDAEAAAARARTAPAAVAQATGAVPTQARSVRSREQILDATIECLLTHGYAATTTQRVQELAGVSRGRLLYHFPNKRELIAAAVARAADKRLDAVTRDRDREIRGVAADPASAPTRGTTAAAPVPGTTAVTPPPGTATAADPAPVGSSRPDPAEIERRIATTVDELWASHSEPIFWVAVESWNAARTDARLAALTREHERSVMRRVRQTTRANLGPRLAEVPGTDALMDTVFTSMRGVAMTYTFSGRSMATEPMLATWKELLRSHFEHHPALAAG